MELQEEINKLRQSFRVLEGWEINLDTESQYKSQFVINVKKKMATIYDWGGEQEVPEDYIFHELMHICIRAIHHPTGFRREAEEQFVQDLSHLYKELKQ